MQQDIIDLITTDRFVQLEDDTLAPVDTIPRLLSLLEKHKNCGIATAIETGRSFEPWIKTRTGVHYLKMKENKLMERISLSPWHKGLVKVDGCGYYCFATWTHLWKETFKLMPKDMSDIPRFAMDNIQTNKVLALGFDILADFSLWCTHMNLTPEKILFWGRPQAVKMADLWIPRYNTYAQGIILKDPLKK